MRFKLIILLLCFGYGVANAQTDTTKTSKKEELVFDEQGRQVFDDAKERKGVKYRFIPLPSYDPSTKWGVSIINMFTYYPSKGDMVSPPSTSAAFASLSLNGTYFLGLNQRLFLKEDSWRITGMVAHGKINQEMLLSVDPTVENSPMETADVSSYMNIAQAVVERKVFDNVYAGMGYIYSGRRMKGRDANSSEILERNGFSDELEDFHGIRYTTSYDSRDNVNYPYSGIYTKLTVDQMLGDDSPNIYLADYRQFITLGDNVSNVLALHAYGRFVSDEAPRNFWSNYGRSGPAVQRGYEVGKYMDRNLVSFEAEYRKETPWMNHKLGFIGAIGMGKVYGSSHDSNNVSQKFSDAPWLPSVVVGARYRLMPYERLNLKVDYAVGRDGGVIYFGITEAF